MLLDLAGNAVEAEQRSPARATFTIAPAPGPSSLPTTSVPAGRRRRFDLDIDGEGTITRLALGTAPDPKGRVMGYVRPTTTTKGSLTTTVALVGFGTGGPGMRLELSAAPVADGTVGLWTVEAGTASRGSSAGRSAPQARSTERTSSTPSAAR